MSARYAAVPDESYVPTVERIVRGSRDAHEKNRQAGRKDGAPAITMEGAASFLDDLRSTYECFDDDYSEALRNGVPKELARLNMPVGRYSQMRASASLRNWLGFLTLRLDPHAQWEIREYARAVHRLVTERFPQTAALFDEGRKP